jgi:hypothetical protein
MPKLIWIEAFEASEGRTRNWAERPMAMTPTPPLVALRNTSGPSALIMALPPGPPLPRAVPFMFAPPSRCAAARHTTISSNSAADLIVALGMLGTAGGSSEARWGFLFRGGCGAMAVLYKDARQAQLPANFVGSCVEPGKCDTESSGVEAAEGEELPDEKFGFKKIMLIVTAYTRSV